MADKAPRDKDRAVTFPGRDPHSIISAGASSKAQTQAGAERRQI
jgi:hypothetical protein